MVNSGDDYAIKEFDGNTANFLYNFYTTVTQDYYLEAIGKLFPIEKTGTLEILADKKIGLKISEYIFYKLGLFHKVWFRILKYISKGFVIENLNDFTVLKYKKSHIKSIVSKIVSLGYKNPSADFNRCVKISHSDEKFKYIDIIKTIDDHIMLLQQSINKLERIKNLYSDNDTIVYFNEDDFIDNTCVKFYGNVGFINKLNRIEPNLIENKAQLNRIEHDSDDW